MKTPSHRARIALRLAGLTLLAIAVTTLSGCIYHDHYRGHHDEGRWHDHDDHHDDHGDHHWRDRDHR